MQTFIFDSANSSIVIIISADNEDEARETLDDLVDPGMNDFFLSRTEGEDEI